MNTTNGVTNFSHNNALLTSGSYTVAIQNTAKGAATITVTGLYQTGIKQAQRRITTKVIQTNIGPYTANAALFVGGPNPGNIDIHNMNVNFGGAYAPAGIYSGGDITFGGNATVTVTENILANGSTSNGNSTINLPPGDPLALPPVPAGVEQGNYSQTFTMPGIDVSSSSPTSYKSKATAQGHYYASAQFDTLINSQTTLTGIYYVAGASGVNIKNQNLTVNGILVSEGSVSVKNGNLTINHSSGPSGLVTLGSFSTNNATIIINGLLYVGVSAASSNNTTMTVNGAILTHDYSGNNTDLTLNFRPDWVNEALTGGGSSQTPVIQLQHWEEEY
jgi:hypothetical protein